MGHARGEYQFLHPNNDVNMSQSTNDVYPTAVRLALILADDPLIEALRELGEVFEAKGRELASVLKMGRTLTIAGCRTDDLWPGIRGLGGHRR